MRSTSKIQIDLSLDVREAKILKRALDDFSRKELAINSDSKAGLSAIEMTQEIDAHLPE